MGKRDYGEISSEAKEHLYSEDHPMPTMKAQVKRVHFTKSEEEHKKDKPRKDGFEWQKPRIGYCADDHWEPESVGIEEFFQNSN